MKKLVLIRHGSYENNQGEEGSLTNSGKEEMQRLAEFIDVMIDEETEAPPVMFSSPRLRSLQSACIIAEHFMIGFETAWSLSSRNGFFDRDTLLSFIRSHAKQCDVMLLVTHLEIARDFPAYFGKEFLKTKRPLHGAELRPGTALLIDCALGFEMTLSSSIRAEV